MRVKDGKITQRTQFFSSSLTVSRCESVSGRLVLWHIFHNFVSAVGFDQDEIAESGTCYRVSVWCYLTIDARLLLSVVVAVCCSIVWIKTKKSRCEISDCCCEKINSNDSGHCSLFKTKIHSRQQNNRKK